MFDMVLDRVPSPSLHSCGTLPARSAGRGPDQGKGRGENPGFVIVSSLVPCRGALLSAEEGVAASGCTSLDPNSDGEPLIPALTGNQAMQVISFQEARPDIRRAPRPPNGVGWRAARAPNGAVMFLIPVVDSP